MRSACVIGCIALAGTVAAQSVVPVAELDTATILIGGQARLDLSVTYRADAGGVSIAWPAITDTLTGKVEVAADSGVDTVLLKPQEDPYLFAQRRTLTITSFDSGYWAIPPFRFVINGDTAETAPLLLEVHTVEVDTTSAFRDIKDIYELPFSWTYWLRQNWPYIAGGAAVLASVLLLVREARRRKKRPAAAPVKEALKPLHVRTLEALDEVARKKLWQQGLVKQHHTETTDILRGYIEARFHVPALERTTDELMKELSLGSMGAAHREQLRNLLMLADMVKFAKWHPSPTENEQVLAGAIQLVQETALIETPTTHAPRS